MCFRSPTSDRGAQAVTVWVQLLARRRHSSGVGLLLALSVLKGYSVFSSGTSYNLK